MPTKDTPKLPDAYFQAHGSQFWFKLDSRRYLPLDKSSLKTQLQLEGFNCNVKISLDKGGKVRLGDHLLARIQRERFVDYAGPLAGHKLGLYTNGDGRRILVSSEATPVQPKKGCADWCQKYFDELLGPEQTHWLLLWWRFALESLDKGDFRPGQFPALCGPSGCGKSLSQLITTALLGGRHADPIRYMSGKTNFNADLAEAEHLPIEDPAGLSLDMRSRLTLGENIKQVTVVENWSVHGKGLKAVPLRFFKRGSITLNDQPEKVSVLPPLTDDLEDKITLLRCSKATMLSEDREKNWASVVRELPALSWIARSASVPKGWRDARYGVRRYHDQELFAMLDATTPEKQLLELIDQVIFERQDGEDWDNFKKRAATWPWRGSASALAGELASHRKLGFQAQRLASLFTSAIGTFLARLRVKFPSRFSTTTNKGHTVWIIEKGATEK